ncbi:MAG: SOS response-associated peptidase [Desulfobacterales bacterium]|nr:SOS response-associated peptidase [Desulfobacterales bacterium]
MCGRFARYSLSRELERYFNASPAIFRDSSPTTTWLPPRKYPSLFMHEDERHIKKRHWGLVPFWAKDISIGSRMINARVETVTSKPAFRAALKQRRCLIPADGFYEWFGKSGSKQPYYFHLPSGEPFAFAGLYEIWEDKEAPPEAGPYKSCTIITTEASESVKDVHNRMPLILKPEAYDEWLDPSNKEPAKIEELLRTRYVMELKRLSGVEAGQPGGEQLKGMHRAAKGSRG